MHWIMWCNPVHHIQRTLLLCSSGLIEEAQVEDSKRKKNLNQQNIKKLITALADIIDERPRLRTEVDYKPEEAAGSSSTAPLPLAAPPTAVGELISWVHTGPNVAVDADYQPPANSQGIG